MTAKICDRIIFGAGCCLVFFLPVSIAATNIAVYLCIAAFLVRMFAPGQLRVRRRYAVILCAYMLVVVVSVLTALDTPAGIRGIQRLMKYAFIFFALSHAFSHQKELRRISQAFLFGLLLVSVDGLVQFIGGEDFLRHSALEIGNSLEGFGGQFKRINASFHNSQDFAGYLAGSVPLALCVARYGSGSPLKKIFDYLVLVLAGVCLIFTYSRGAAVGLITAVLLCAFVKKDRLIAALLLLLILCAPLFLADAPLQWASHRKAPLEFFYDSSRLMHWRTALNMISAHPFAGIGANSFCASYEYYRGPGDHYVGWYAHNSWLQLAAETGIIGAGLIVFLVALVVRGLWRAYRGTHDQDLSGVMLGLCAGLVSYCVAAFWDSSMQYSNPAVFFWTLLGLSAAAAYLSYCQQRSDCSNI